MEQPDNMRREFSDRSDLIAYLTQEFPQAAAISDAISSIRGGHTEAEMKFKKFDAGKEYTHTRNQLDGAVSRLSPYIRYGVLSLAEVRTYSLQSVPSMHDAEKFISELGWCDFFQRKYEELGDDIWDDIEPYKTGFHSDQYADHLPDDIRMGQTGIPFIDDFAEELITTGYLHNHSRMWLAAYIVHWRKIKWQAGARWFLSHLLDGDPASNNLSWQWVASTFSHKPYYFNLENVRKFTAHRYLEDHPAYTEFDASYDVLAQQLFPYAELSDTSSSSHRRSKTQQKSQRRRY